MILIFYVLYILCETEKENRLKTRHQTMWPPNSRDLDESGARTYLSEADDLTWMSWSVVWLEHRLRAECHLASDWSLARS